MLRLSQTEAQYVQDILDLWIDGYKDTAEDAEDGEVPVLMDQMEVAMRVRERIRRRVRRTRKGTGTL